MMKAIVSGLSNEHLDYLSKALDMGMGAGVVSIESYEPDDINLVTTIRLKYNSPEIILIALSEEAENAISSSLPMLQSSEKYFRVSNTLGLVRQLESYYSINLGYSVEEVPTESSSAVVEELKSLISAKEGTIASLEALVSDLTARLEYMSDYAFDELQLALVPKQIVETSDSNYESIILEKDSLIQELTDSKTILEDEILGLRSSLSQLSEDKQYLEDLAKQNEELIAENSDLTSQNETLQSRVSYLEQEKSIISNKFSAESGIVRSQRQTISSLKEELELTKSLIDSDELDTLKSKNEELTKELSSSKSIIEGKDSEIQTLTSRVSELELNYSRLEELRLELESKDEQIANLRRKVTALENENLNSSSREVLEERIRSLTVELKTEKENVMSLNKMLLKGENLTPEVKESSKSLKDPIPQTLWGIANPFRNISFLFAGSGDSLREAYIYGYNTLKSSGQSLFLELVTESSVDYRFQVHKLKDSTPWLETGENLRDATSKGKNGIFVVTSCATTCNEEALLSLDLLSRLQEVDSLGLPVIVFGGSISSHFARVLMSSGLISSSVSVVCRNLGTSLRTMLYSAELVSNSISARYYVMGKSNEMSNKVIKTMQKRGYSVEVVNEES